MLDEVPDLVRNPVAVLQVDDELVRVTVIVLLDDAVVVADKDGLAETDGVALEEAVLDLSDERLAVDVPEPLLLVDCDRVFVGEADTDLVGSLESVVVAEEVEDLEGTVLLENVELAEADLVGLLVNDPEGVEDVVLDTEVDNVEVLEVIADTVLATEAEDVFVEITERVGIAVNREEYVKKGESVELLLANGVRVLIAVLVEVFELRAEVVGRI